MTPERRRQAVFILCATVCGTLSTLSYHPAGWPLAAPAALLLLFYLVWRSASWRQVFLVGMAFGFSFFLAGLWWIFNALSGHVGLPAAGALPLTVLFCLLLALFPALAVVAAAALTAPGGLRRLLALAACWTLAEWLRGWVLTGFPWLALGYSQIPDGWFAAWAPIAGIFGVTLALALGAAGLLALLFLPRRRLLALAALAVLLALPPLVNSWRWTMPAGTLKVSLLQGNVAQSLKWEADEVRQALDDYLRLAAAADGRVVVMPETALPMLIEELPPGYLEKLRALAGDRLGAVIAGAFVRGEQGLYNAAVALEKDSTEIYRKVHLTPYGEYLPLAEALAPLLGAADIPYASLAAGEAARPLPLPDGIRTAISICYEDIFGNEWRRQVPDALFLTNITNDAWFDGTVMPHQHLQISQARALESGRWLARATNTGITAVIDHKGRIVSQLPQQVQGVLSEEIALYRGATPYVLWGDAPAAALAALLLALSLPFGDWRRRWRQRPIDAISQ